MRRATRGLKRRLRASLAAARLPTVLRLRQMRGFGRKQMCHPSDVPLRHLVHANLTALARLADDVRRLVAQRQRPGVRLAGATFVVEGAELIVHVDPAQLEQALRELVLNARDAMRACRPDGRRAARLVELSFATVDVHEAFWEVERLEAGAGWYRMLLVQDWGAAYRPPSAPVRSSRSAPPRVRAAGRGWGGPACLASPGNRAASW